MTRLYLLGRTETVRSLTAEGAEFIRYDLTLFTLWRTLFRSPLNDGIIGFAVHKRFSVFIVEG